MRFLNLRYKLLVILFFWGVRSIAQKDTCEFILVDTSVSAKANTYYLASNINGWNPADTSFRFKKDEAGSNYLIASFDKDTHLEFKFTKGGWNTVECNAKGEDVSNHSLRADKAKFTVYYIGAWKDQFPVKGKQHTASLNVHIFDTAFFIPQLNRTRRIWIYLPADYGTSNKHYPVLYMHDGQNLFDAYTSGYGEWGIDETLDSLINKGIAPCIVVGIDCGPQRLNEYNPYSNERFGKGEGDQYIDFLIATLKPYIDQHYHTLSSKQNTIIAGSSMGGLISYYAILKHPDVFGKAGVFSPSFWIAPEIQTATESLKNNLTGKIFFYAGGKEGSEPMEMINDMRSIETKLSGTKVKTTERIDPNAQHNEKAWRQWFPEFYKWIMSN
ncbi:alpha/beta hydrolase [Ferruginibacter albus]|uniref:alpha/beta hydrolase n=1 Tax=Ferruginibacter albus TaxID=2875540 RepID=UPI001CC6E083|nr:alpha/beta hydrolase-fold protein [Ferruginibacter albus]UAY50881.1 hypothetical protein K9M53_09795 [Ferruginibacter albus]